MSSPSLGVVAALWCYAEVPLGATSVPARWSRTTQSECTSLFNLEAVYWPGCNVRLALDVFKLFDAETEANEQVGQRSARLFFAQPGARCKLRITLDKLAASLARVWPRAYFGPPPEGRGMAKDPVALL